SRPLYQRRAGAYPGRSPPHPRARARPDRHLVVGDLAAGAAPGRRRVAAGEHLHDLVCADRGGVELAAHADVGSDRSRGAAAQAWAGARDRPGCRSEKKVIEQAYREAEARGVAVACQDEAGPYQTVPSPGHSWEPQAHPRRQPHEYLRLGTVKLLTLLRPA